MASLTAAQDQRLSAGLHGRDESALGDIYDRYSDLVFGIALGIVGDPRVAADLTTEVFIALWTRPADFDPGAGSMRSHLAAKAHRLAVDRHRNDVARASGGGSPGIRSEVSGSASVFRVSSVLAEVVRDTLDQLPEDQRSAVEWAFFDGCTYPEVAARTGVTAEAALSCLSEAMRNLTKRLEDRGATTPP